MIDTNNGIHPFLYFDTNIAQGSISTAHTYEAVHGNTSATKAAAWRSHTSGIETSYYIPFMRDYGTWYGSPFPTWLTLAQWQTQHPNWIMYKSDGVTPAYFSSDPEVPLDFTNPDVRAWQLSQYGVPTSQNGNFTYLFADNLELDNARGCYGIYASAIPGGDPFGGGFTQLFTGSAIDATWTTAVIAWCTAMRTSLAALSPSLKLCPNMDPGHFALTSTEVQTYIANVDAMFDEGGFTDFAFGNLQGSAWIERVQFMQYVQNQGKPYYLVCQNPVPTSPISDLNSIQFCLAGYLMGKQHSAALYVSGNQAYGSQLWYNAFDLAIGTPLEDMTLDQTIYRRRYQNCLVLYNPNTTVVTYTMPVSGTWQSLTFGSYGGLYNGTAHIGGYQSLVLTPYLSPPAATVPYWLFHS